MISKQKFRWCYGSCMQENDYDTANGHLDSCEFLALACI